MIRILLVDDHPAMRAGLAAVLRAEPGLVPLEAIGSAAELMPALRRTRPDVVVLDYHLPGADGLAICRELKRVATPPGVLLYSAYADGALAVPAILAGADGLLHKAAPAPELYDAIRTVARGGRVLPPITRALLTSASTILEPEDLPILSMVLDGVSPAEVAATLRVGTADILGRLDVMLERLHVDVAAPAM